MRLTTLTDYALRMLVHLAVAPEGRATIAAVAEAFGISENHLMKVAHQLGQSGHILTLRGRGGGLALARPAEAITVGDVVRRMEPDLALVPCMGGGACAILPACRLKQALHQARAAFLAVLDGTTLADIAQPQAELRELLGLPA
ncbi:Rrf2 family transcriptional regulator [Roseomonas frigidaquae]|uniref:Rrf2 family transcriptional regulator n=1 Tax=Falsiroseomonas frigidaquae TaxID=487318 RepID=A0ABX1EYA3_9PROT|nr:Rrf2 family transcriptional regulator [Falsiroseomonas frigidaquae]NKE45081.1 Rrf2 family transcriptional regulator [Falsiroseomonas frigidaquae]